MNFKNFKFVKKLKSLAPKIKWLTFKNSQNPKTVCDYINYILPDEKNSVEKDSQHLENIVADALVKEFGPEIKNSKSYGLLLDAVVHNLKKKQLQAYDDLDEELEI